MSKEELELVMPAIHKLLKRPFIILMPSDSGQVMTVSCDTPPDAVQANLIAASEAYMPNSKPHHHFKKPKDFND